jgi:hypothetical protein
LKAFREVFGGGLADAREFAGKLRRGGYEGTFVETELLSDRLRREDVLSAVVRVDAEFA